LRVKRKNGRRLLLLAARATIVFRPLPSASYNPGLKTLTVRLPDRLRADLEAEARARKLTKSDAIRERLSAPSSIADQRPPSLRSIAHLVGSVVGLPADLSTNVKKYLKAGYGLNRSR
jgi:hypothetical protein